MQRSSLRDEESPVDTNLIFHKIRMNKLECPSHSPLLDSFSSQITDDRGKTVVNTSALLFCLLVCLVFIVIFNFIYSSLFNLAFYYFMPLFTKYLS